MMTAVEDRVAEYSGIPWTHQEQLQLLRYRNGQEYAAHNDGIDSGENGGKRIATVLMFLREPESGGETNFPDAKPFPKVKQAFLANKNQFSECAWNNGVGFSVKPRRGDAILFFSFHINGTVDTLSTHGSCPTLQGTKYTATKWIHENTFDTATWVKPTCVNKNEKCEEWAQNGECERNPTYMIGTDTIGSCSKSCCDVMDRMELTMTQRRICEPCDEEKGAAA
jgi:prolyl 4-hydroxylase